MPVREVDPADRRALKRFVALERELLSHHVRYVSELDADVRRRLSGRSAFQRGIDQLLLVASDDAETDVARCAAFVNPRWQEFHREPAAFIGYFAAAPRHGEHVRRMLGAAEAWLAERGVTRVIAPYNATAMLGMGLQTDAFDEDPMFPFPWTPPYYAHELQRAGYAPTYPMWFYEIDFGGDAYREAVRRALADPPCRVRRIDKKRWPEEIALWVRLFNEGFTAEWEMHPYTVEEFRGCMTR